MGEVTLDLYKAEERRLAVTDARRGLWVHATVVVIVAIALTLVNIFVTPEFPWAIFPAVGMGVGVWCHWHFGVERGEEFMARHQDKVEQEAKRHGLAA